MSVMGGKKVRKAARIALPVFQSNRWGWASTTHRPDGVPTLVDIEQTIFHLLGVAKESARRNDNRKGSAATGRLQVEVDLEDKTAEVFLSLGWDCGDD